MDGAKCGAATSDALLLAGFLKDAIAWRERYMPGKFPQALTRLINAARLLSIPAQEAKRASDIRERLPAATQTRCNDGRTNL